MSCCRCESPDALREKARVSALEQQNTDLIKIVGKLIERRLDFKFNLDPNMYELKMGDYQNFMVREAAKRATVAIERMLEDRRQFFRDYDLLKLTATPEYWREVNKGILGMPR